MPNATHATLATAQEPAYGLMCDLSLRPEKEESVEAQSKDSGSTG